ncbi:MAG: radical SAM protein, partial [Flavobacteriales bacterium]|nr:radical SAM protein [Flavobacteriales bacterium]
MNSAKLDRIVQDHKLPKFRKGQMSKAFFSEAVQSFDEITTFSKDLRNQLTEKENVLTFTLHKLYVSTAKNAFKALLKLEDGKVIESVLLNPKPGLWTTCISSQVGCALGCDFCATGTMGWIRNLTSEEITDQVLFWRFYMKEELKESTLNNVVYMGMGEPLHNKKEVFSSLDELMNPDTFNMGARHLSVSTVGLVPAMKELTDRFPQVNLAVSLHAPNDETRLSMMPINKPYP